MSADGLEELLEAAAEEAVAGRVGEVDRAVADVAVAVPPCVENGFSVIGSGVPKRAIIGS